MKRPTIAQVARKDLLDCVEALLAHVIGRRVRYPGTLAQARPRLLETPSSRAFAPMTDGTMLLLPLK